MSSNSEDYYEVPEAIVEYIHERTGYPVKIIKRILLLERLYYSARMIEEQS